MYRVFATYILAFFSSITLAQIHVSGMPLEVLQTMEAQQNAWNEGDLDAFMNGYWESDSLLFIGKSGLNNGYLNTLNNYKKAYPDKNTMGTLSFKNMSWTPLSDSAALLIGSWQISEEQNGMYSLIWKNIDGRWVIIADHSSG
ncbi:MAG: DUF4440 domain-containing protein [Crocinitomicaceae bacterium]|nr:DUF4440 domain-containing protein [Crocinitomicaceae bacterium]|tara:strand:+ start:13824 stop:14252 length:429 start_codon:yes stop_codon:yes gene_type:complete